MASSEWFDVFLNYEIYHLNSSVSNHCPLLLDTIVTIVRNFRQRPSFKFEVKWLLEKSLNDTVASLWTEAQHLLASDRLAFLINGLQKRRLANNIKRISLSKNSFRIGLRICTKKE